MPVREQFKKPTPSLFADVLGAVGGDEHTIASISSQAKARVFC